MGSQSWTRKAIEAVHGMETRADIQRCLAVHRSSLIRAERTSFMEPPDALTTVRKASLQDTLRKAPLQDTVRKASLQANMHKASLQAARSLRRTGSAAEMRAPAPAAAFDGSASASGAAAPATDATLASAPAKHALHRYLQRCRDAVHSTDAGQPAGNTVRCMSVVL